MQELRGFFLGALAAERAERPAVAFASGISATSASSGVSPSLGRSPLASQAGNMGSLGGGGWDVSGFVFFVEGGAEEPQAAQSSNAEAGHGLFKACHRAPRRRTSLTRCRPARPARQACPARQCPGPVGGCEWRDQGTSAVICPRPSAQSALKRIHASEDMQPFPPLDQHYVNMEQQLQDPQGSSKQPQKAELSWFHKGRGWGRLHEERDVGSEVRSGTSPTKGFLGRGIRPYLTNGVSSS